MQVKYSRGTVIETDWMHEHPPPSHQILKAGAMLTFLFRKANGPPFPMLYFLFAFRQGDIMKNGNLGWKLNGDQGRARKSNTATHGSVFLFLKKGDVIYMVMFIADRL